MKSSTGQLLQKKYKEILDLWMRQQLTDASLREDLMANEDLRHDYPYFQGQRRRD